MCWGYVGSMHSASLQGAQFLKKTTKQALSELLLTAEGEGKKRAHVLFTKF